MEDLLKHLIDITGQRDHTLLDSSVISAFHSMTGATQVRVRELSTYRDALFVRTRSWTEGNRVIPATESLHKEFPGEPIEQFPGLISALQERKTCVEESTPEGLVLWLPVWINDKVRTCIEIVHPSLYSEQTFYVVEGILSVYRNYQTILDYSERDSLTGLLNRKTFDEKLSRLLSTALPEYQQDEKGRERRQHAKSESQWLGVIDIDHFKRINDQFGHLYGDEVLILVANLLRASFREQDSVFRFGGEEFVVLLRSTTLDEAQRIFERFRANVENHAFPQVDKVTASVGFARITQDSPVVILGHADEALYYAKENGRNRVCHYDGLVEAGLLRSAFANASDVEFF